MKKYSPLLVGFLLVTYQCIAQTDSHTRAVETVAKLHLNDGDTKRKAQDILQQHFDSLQAVFIHRKAAIQNAGNNAGSNKELTDARGRTAWDAANGRLNKLQAVFLGKLSVLLSMEQMELLKNLMTEGRLETEYNTYLEMFPALNDVQKSQVLAYLKEARENAMNAETAQNRLDWFIKFRGRANNYLAAAGYNLRKATEELEAKKGGKL